MNALNSCKKNHTMKIFYSLLALIVGVSLSAQTVFINEIHYDNISGDVNEAIEIAGPAGTVLSSYTIELYNNVGSLYDTKTLTGTIPDQQNGFGTLTFLIEGIQNGPADGFALIDGGVVIQLLSYEGTLTPAEGTASGMTSVDIGVVESNSTTAITESLQLSGTGMVYTDFVWQSPNTATQGSLNNSQVFSIVLSNPQVEELKNETIIFPNPSTNGEVLLVTPLNKVELSIYNSLGVKISTQFVTNGEAIAKEKLTAGIYFVQLTVDGNTVTKKLIVQ